MEVRETDLNEAVGVFKAAEALQEAIDDLLSSGFDRADLSLLASEHADEEKLGHKYQKVAEVEDDPAAPRCCYVSKEAIDAAKGALVGSLLYVGPLRRLGLSSLPAGHWPRQSPAPRWPAVPAD